MMKFFEHLVAYTPVIFFWMIAAMVGASAIMVVVTQNIVRSATWLLFTLSGVSILYFQLGADFVGATQLIVYVGGTLVLVVFGVMLTAQGPFVTLKTPAGEWALAVVSGFLFLGVLVAVTANAAPAKTSLPDRPQAGATARIGFGFLGITDAADAKMGVQDGRYTATVEEQPTLTNVPNAPKRTRVGYLFPFEIVSVHLVVVLIGAAYLARAKRRERTTA